MAATLKLGDRKWATKEGSLLAYNDENNNYKPLPFDFTRASSATRVNKQGLIETVASGVPRIDFTDANGALKLEPQRTNLFLNSEPTSNEGAMGGVSYESFDWAIGFTNCVKFGDNSTIRYRYGASAVNATQYAVSAFVIMDDLSEPVVSGLSSNGDFSFAIGGSLAYSVNPNIDMGNNIWKVSASIPSGGNSANNGIIKYTTQSNKGFRVVGYQLELGSYATSYIPTQGSAVTRIADACSGAGNATVFADVNASGVLFAEISALSDSLTNRIISLSDSSANNRVVLYYSTSTNQIIILVRVSGTTVASMSYTLSDETLFSKIAIRWSLNDFSLWVNGVKVVIDTNGIVYPANTLSELAFDDSVGTGNFYGKTKQLQVLSYQTDTEMIALTSL
jgi:hypothetical protein